MMLVILIAPLYILIGRTLHVGTGASVDSIHDDQTSSEEGDHWLRCQFISCRKEPEFRSHIHILPGNFLGRKPGILSDCLMSGLVDVELYLLLLHQGLEVELRWGSSGKSGQPYT